MVFNNITSLSGAGRYVPGSASNAVPPVGGVDPFTGKRQCPASGKLSWSFVFCFLFFVFLRHEFHIDANSYIIKNSRWKLLILWNYSKNRDNRAFLYMQESCTQALKCIIIVIWEDYWTPRNYVVDQRNWYIINGHYTISAAIWSVSLRNHYTWW